VLENRLLRDRRITRRDLAALAGEPKPASKINGPRSIYRNRVQGVTVAAFLGLLMDLVLLRLLAKGARISPLREIYSGMPMIDVAALWSI